MTWSSDLSTSLVCVKATVRPSLAAAELHSGDFVTVHMIRTPLGDVIQRIDLDNPPRVQ